MGADGIAIVEKTVASVAAVCAEGVLLVRRARGVQEVAVGEGMWELPGGKPDAGESLADAAVREMREEVGWGPKSAEGLVELGTIRQSWLGVGDGGGKRGGGADGQTTIVHRTQTVFALHLDDHPDERPVIHIPGGPNAEHDDFTWQDPARLHELPMELALRALLHKEFVR